MPQDTKDMSGQTKATDQLPDIISPESTVASGQGEGSPEGGEFQFLVRLLQGWVDQQGWRFSVKDLGRPIRNLLLLFLALMVFQLVSGFAAALNRIPLLGNFLMLVGLTQIAIFTKRNLLRQSDRQNLRKVINGLLNDTFG